MCDQKKESISQIKGKKTYTIQTFSDNFYSMHTGILLGLGNIEWLMIWDAA